MLLCLGVVAVVTLLSVVGAGMSSCFGTPEDFMAAIRHWEVSVSGRLIITWDF